MYHKRDFTEGPYPEAHTIDGHKVPPDGTAQPQDVYTLGKTGSHPKFQRDAETPMPIGLSYPKGQDFGPYIQHIGEGLPTDFSLDFKNDIPFSCGNVHSHTALLLFSLALNQRPKTILETGTFYGYSTWFFAEALRMRADGGIVYALDPEQKLIADEIKNHPNVECIQARSENYLPEFVKAHPRIDFAFLDSWKRLTLEEFLLIYKAIPEGGIVAFHDSQFLNTGRTLWNFFQADENLKGWDQMLFCGTPHKDNPHHYFGNADDRGLYVLRRREADPWLDVWDANTASMGDKLLVSEAHND
jgi:hypothetical protein